MKSYVFDICALKNLYNDFASHDECEGTVLSLDSKVIRIKWPVKVLELIAKQSFWVSRCDWGFSQDGQIHSHVELETPTQSYFLKMPEFRKWFFELWKNEKLLTACEDENHSMVFSKSGFQNHNWMDFYLWYESKINSYLRIFKSGCPVQFSQGSTNHEIIDQVQLSPWFSARDNWALKS